MLPKLQDATQTITFSEGDGVYSSGITANKVVVTTNAGSHNHGSSMMKVRNIVDYNWEAKYYTGQLLALHKNGKYLAYSMKGWNVTSNTRGMVRVVYNPEPSSDIRLLIKGMKREIQDLAFAHIDSNIILACIDNEGSFYIHEILLADSELKAVLLLEVREDSPVLGANHRVVWCPYIPDEDDDADDDVSRVLVTTHASIARVWNLRQAMEMADSTFVLGSSSALLAEAVHIASTDGGRIVSANIAPDGTALATAGEDGFVMFFQISSSDKSPRCLHKWNPHDGEPITCLYFLDNYHTYTSEEQFWKYAVTGTSSNSILKIWSCKTWTCLQTITFAPSINTDTSISGIKVQVDSRARYIMASELKTRCLYIMEVKTDGDAYCTSICEFTAPHPLLSFIHVSDENIPKCDSNCGDPYHRNGSSNEHGMSPLDYVIGNESPSGTMSSSLTRMKMFVVQPKSLQEAIITYATPEPCNLNILASDVENDVASGITSSILQQQSQQLKMLLMKSQTQPGSLMAQRPESPPPLNLMTPDAFSSPGKRDEEDPPLSATPDVTTSQRPSLSSTAISAEITKSSYIEEPQPEPIASAGSSPSGEVQEIMSLHDNDFYQETTANDTSMDGMHNGEDYVNTESSLVEEECDQPVGGGVEPVWPQMPIAPLNESNVTKASSEKSSTRSLNQSVNLSNVPLNMTFESEMKPMGDKAYNANKLEALERKLDVLTDLVHEQNREIRTLRSEIFDPREVIEEVLITHTNRTAAAIENALAEGWERVCTRGEAAGRAAATAAGRGAARALEPLVASLQHQLAQKLTTTDHLLRENIEKLLNNQSVLDKLGASVSTALADLVKVWFRDAVTASVLPAMERTHQSLFKQLNLTFQQGAKDFAANTEALARAAAERGGASAAGSLRSALDRHTQLLNTQLSHTQISNIISDAAKSVLEKELGAWRQEARAVVAEMSRAHSPASSVTPSAKDRRLQVLEIQSLLSSGDVNGAFQLALSAADLTVVMCACRGAAPGTVFGPPCVLRPHVVLSLIQQLAADMTHDTQLKHRYLEEAILSLDISNPVTREHLPAILRELQKQVNSFLGSNPGHPLYRQLRMLNMAADSLLNSL